MTGTNLKTSNEGSDSQRWAKSLAFLDRARRSLSGGVSSPFRAKAPVPLYLKDARGSRIWDVDGNEYIDYSLAWGPLILGHCHPAVVAAIQQHSTRPHIYGAQHELEFQVAEAIQRVIPCAERVCFTSSGSEAVQIALRLARAFTGRRLVLKFEGHYHGWMDSVLLSYKPSAADLSSAPRFQGIPGSRGQVLNAVENVVVAEWNDRNSVEAAIAKYGPEIATIIAEPVVCNCGCLPPEGEFLNTLAQMARANGSLLIFDEIITGFRHRQSSAQAFYRVVPDIATLGKALGGGLTLSALVGRAEILEMIGSSGVAFGGTFNGNPLSLAAAAVVIEELGRNDAALLQQANQTGETIMQGIREAAVRRGIPLLVTGFGTAFAVHFTNRKDLRTYRDTLDDDGGRLQAFLLEALAEGVNIIPDGRMYVSAAHSAQDAQVTIAALECALSRVG